MASVFKYLKRKLKRPFRRCVGTPSNSFVKCNSPKETKFGGGRGDEELTTDLENLRCTTMQSASNNKFTSNSRQKTDMSSANTGNLTCDYTTQSTDLGFGSSSMSKSITDKSSDLENAFIYNIPNTPISSLTSNMFSAFSSNTNQMSNHDNNSNLPLNAENQRSPDHAKPMDDLNTTNSSDSSMITYNTKYSNSDDDGLISMNKSSSAVSLNNPQQSTPFNENPSPKIRIRRKTNNYSVGNLTYKKRITQFEARIQGLKIDTAPNSPKSVYCELYQQNESRKCRRSNTTYTVAKRNRIIDYFNKLEMTKQIRKHKENLRARRNLNRNIIEQTVSSKSMVKSTGNMTCASGKTDPNLSCNNVDEIEKMQDVFFQDESSFMNNSCSSANNNNNNNLNNNTANLSNDNLLLTSFLDSINTSIASNENMCQDGDAASNKETNEKKSTSSPASDLNKVKEENHSINSSIENIRRSHSMPGLGEPNSSLFANISKISTIKEPDESKEEDLLKPSETSQKLDEKSINNNNNEFVTVSDSSECNEFVRNEPQTRLSKNIKQMFKNVVMYQVNALNNLERFYEAQLEKLESEREKSLAQNPNDEKVKEFYEKQLALLEERVHSSLAFICQNKCNNMSRFSQSRLEQDLEQQQQQQTQNDQSNLIEQQKQIFAERLKHFMMVRQRQLQNGQQQVQQQSVNAMRPVTSRTLLSLKNNLISQNSLLPSKNATIGNRPVTLELSEFTTEFDNSPKETVFRRNFSLPYQQRRENPLIAKRLLPQEQDAETKRAFVKLRSPKMGSLAYSSSRKFYQKYGYSPLRSNLSPQSQLTNCSDSTSNDESLSAKSQFQYQKNALRKMSTSNENVSYMKRAYERTSDLAKIVKLNNSNLNNNKILDTFNSTYKKFKKQASYNCVQAIEKCTFRDGVNSSRSSVCLTSGSSVLQQQQKEPNESKLLNNNNLPDNFKRNSFVYFYPSNDLENPDFLNLTSFIETQQQQRPPRLSDSHILFKLRQQQQQQQKNAYNNYSNMHMMKSLSQKAFIIETEV